MVLEALVDLDELLVLWRYRHVQMVRRMIGDLAGTGGSLGARYLQSTLNKNAFPDIWEVRNHLGQGTTPYGSR
jgi:tryptophan 2,3-dioxygenase